MDNLLEKISKLPIGDTKLDNQISFMKTLSEIITSPLVISILSSLKELKGIKQNQIEKLKIQN